MKKIAEIKEELQKAAFDEREALYEAYKEDTRAGVLAVIEQYKKREEKLLREKECIEQLKFYEKKYEKYYSIIFVNFYFATHVISCEKLTH